VSTVEIQSTFGRSRIPFRLGSVVLSALLVAATMVVAPAVAKVKALYLIFKAFF
jgi:hypothetical protein